MLIPKRVKHRKWQKRVQKGKELRAAKLTFGKYGLKAIKSSWLDSRQIEAARRAMMRYIQKGGKIWIRVFPDQPITKKPAGLTMGGGKGQVDRYIFQVLPGRILFEMDGVNFEVAQEALRLAASKLPMKTKFISK